MLICPHPSPLAREVTRDASAERTNGKNGFRRISWADRDSRGSAGDSASLWDDKDDAQGSAQQRLTEDSVGDLAGRASRPSCGAHEPADSPPPQAGCSISAPG